MSGKEERGRRAEEERKRTGGMTKYHHQLQLTILTPYPPQRELQDPIPCHKSTHAHTHTPLALQSAPHVSSGCRSMADLMRYFKRVCHASVLPPTPHTKSRGPWSVKREQRPSMGGQLPRWAKWNWWAATHCAGHTLYTHVYVCAHTQVTPDTPFSHRSQNSYVECTNTRAVFCPFGATPIVKSQVKSQVL